MLVTILGCGGSAGVPHIGGKDGRGDWGACDPNEPRNRRTRSSIVIQSGEGALLVDTGPEMREQLLACGVPKIDAVLYTHAHADHIAGLDDIRILNRIVDRPLDAFGTKETLDELNRRFDYAFRPWKPPGFFRPVLIAREITLNQTETILGMPVKILDQDHGFIRTVGLRIGRFAYSTDLATLDEAGLENLRGVETWIVDCFQRRPHKTHANVEQVLDWAERLQIRRTILTHMSYDLDWAWMQRRLPDGVEPAYDTMRIEIAD